MEEQIINAATNADLANNLISNVMAEEPKVEPAKITLPSETLVNLPGGYVTATGEVIKTAEVRELNGRDEEIIIRNGNSPKIFSSILSRGVVAIGTTTASDEVLDSLLIGDRDALLLGIFKVTFGSEVELGSYCNGCSDVKTVLVDVDKDIKSRILVDPVSDRTFTVKGKANEFLVTLPTGITQKKLLANPELNVAESMTVLLEQTVLEIDGRPVVSKQQIQALGLLDRRAIAEEINKRTPGPQLEDLTVTCPDCESEVQVPISFGTLFRF